MIEPRKLRFRACGRDFCGSVRAVENFAVLCVRLWFFFLAVPVAVQPQTACPSLVKYLKMVRICVNVSIIMSKSRFRKYSYLHISTSDFGLKLPQLYICSGDSTVLTEYCQIVIDIIFNTCKHIHKNRIYNWEPSTLFFRLLETYKIKKYLYKFINYDIININIINE